MKGQKSCYLRGGQNNNNKKNSPIGKDIWPPVGILKKNQKASPSSQDIILKEQFT